VPLQKGPAGGHRHGQCRIRDGIVPAADALTPARSGRPTASNYRLVALIVASALFMEFVDATVLATALPTMARDFGVPSEMSIALTSYLLALAVFIPASGLLADRYGSRTVFRSAIALFVRKPGLRSGAPLGAMVLARFLQGMGGAMMILVGRLVLLRSGQAGHGQPMSWLLVPALVGPVVAPLGGFIVTYLDWRWIFYINLPVGVLGFCLVSRFIANFREDHTPRFDAGGFVLSGLARLPAVRLRWPAAPDRASWHWPCWRSAPCRASYIRHAHGREARSSTLP
jgi:MFS family permease